MNLPDIREANLGGKRILMRVNFDVQFFNGKPKEVYRIKSAKRTIDFILSKRNVKLALISHLGRPKMREERLSFKNFYQEIGLLLKKELVFTDECFGPAVKKDLDNLKAGQVLMLENVRFHPEELKSDIDFAKKLSLSFDVYVNEAFGSAHRDHASTSRIPRILPSYAGLTLQKEVKELTKLRTNYNKPAIAIIGGAKVETKIPVIRFFADRYDKVLIGGKLGIEAQKNNIVFPSNVMIPSDYQGEGLDIGAKTVREFAGYIERARTIIWNGPMGYFENPPYDKGTQAILELILKNHNAYKVAGGGETLQVLEEKNLLLKFDFVSTGGGAMLEFLAKGTLSALEALRQNKK